MSYHDSLIYTATRIEAKQRLDKYDLRMEYLENKDSLTKSECVELCQLQHSLLGFSPMEDNEEESTHFSNNHPSGF